MWQSVVVPEQVCVQQAFAVSETVSVCADQYHTELLYCALDRPTA